MEIYFEKISNSIFLKNKIIVERVKSTQYDIYRVKDVGEDEILLTYIGYITKIKNTTGNFVKQNKDKIISNDLLKNFRKPNEEELSILKKEGLVKLSRFESYMKRIADNIDE